MMNYKTIGRSSPTAKTQKQTQISGIINEIIKLISYRLEDVQQIQSLSSRTSGKLKTMTQVAENTICEATQREEMRCLKEENLLSRLANTILDQAQSKKILQKTVYKILKQITSQDYFTPSYSSECHMVQVMSKRAGSPGQSPRIPEYELSISPTEFFTTFSPYAKLIEGCLYGNSINPHLIISYLISLSRSCFNEETAAQKSAI